MRNAITITLVFIAALSLCWGCAKEPSPITETELPFSLTVQSESLVRAGLDGASLKTGSYVFAAGDKLYVSGDNGNIHGVLTLVSGEGTGTAAFSGSLSYGGSEEPDDETELTATLVGSYQEDFFTIEGDRITSGPHYPNPIPYADLQVLVQKYSHFTGSFFFGIRKLTLTQQTVFLDFDMLFYKSDLGGTFSEVEVDIKSAGGTVIHSVSEVPLSGNQVVGRVSFSTALSADTDVNNAQIWVKGSDEVHCLPDFSAEADLSVNKYYRVTRNAIEPLTVEAAAAGGTNITFHSSYRANVEYRIFTNENGKWSDWTACPSTAIALNTGDKISFRGKNDVYKFTSNKALFETSNPVYIYGDLMSLVCDENFIMKDALVAEAFKGTFQNMGKLLAHPEKDLILSATDLNTSCYESMFQGCTGLTRVPVTLPATTLANSCYCKMFMKCTGLTSLPAALLPATTLSESCYESMFEECTGLTTASSILPQISTVENSSCLKMFYGCTSLITAPALSFTTVKVSGCMQMFMNCSALTTPPSSLPATTLGEQAYYQMFMNCTGLTSTPSFPGEEGTLTGPQICYQMFNECTELTTTSGKLFTADTQLTEECFHGMFRHCTKLANVPSDFLPSLKMAKWCYRGMFEGAAFATAPILPATTLVNECYRFMFNSCKSLNSITCLATNPNGGAFTANWVGGGVPSGGTFVKNPNTQIGGSGETNWPKNNVNGIPSGWTVQDAQ